MFVGAFRGKASAGLDGRAWCRELLWLESIEPAGPSQIIHGALIRSFENVLPGGSLPPAKRLLGPSCQSDEARPTQRAADADIRPQVHEWRSFPAIPLPPVNPARRLLFGPADVAHLPHFVFSPSTPISAIGLMRGPDRTPATPAYDWRRATVDVVIPARNEQESIVRCLASVLRQTLVGRFQVSKLEVCRLAFTGAIDSCAF